ncbi:conserved uncharacterized mitochondrial protein [Andalucia godoyi]|uniref:Conserved uncharacterized mitochondrial protein n=1 Tax=Andalucia godoyi TaxID=505711 RepID=A0A8K0F2E7_ANDGO|nr:conserved uncharacterized mitochondrial protein [Andalucia godoyi]|eukprot:ANDGO_03454.mRNA.1 conserved uncharacterized mitochondrial protein
MGRSIIGRFNVVPQLLLRMQSGKAVRLRDFAAQQKLGRTSFDVKLQDDGLVHPIPPSTTEFVRPNGMSLRPPGGNFQETLETFQKPPIIFRLVEGTPLPAHFTLLHEHTDHFSLQTTEPVSITELNKRMTVFLSQFQIITTQDYIREFGL